MVKLMHSQLKCSAGYKTAEHCKKYQICMQDKLHAGQYSHFPFEIAELPVVEQLRQQTVNGKELLIADEIFDKTSE
jgi:hypothetical protein